MKQFIFCTYIAVIFFSLESVAQNDIRGVADRDHIQTTVTHCERVHKYVHADIYRLFLEKTFETLRVLAPRIANDTPYPNVDPFDYYYDAAASIDMASKLSLQAGYISVKEYEQFQAYRAKAIAKFLDISDADATNGPDKLNLGNELHFTGVMHWYLEQKESGNAHMPEVQRAKKVLLYNALKGTPWNSIGSKKSYTYRKSAPPFTSMREVGLVLRTVTEAMTVMQEDGDTISDDYLDIFNHALQFVKWHARQVVTGVTAQRSAYKVFYQSFYIGMTATALIVADEYLLKYTGTRDPQIVEAVDQLASFLLNGGGIIHTYDLANATAGEKIRFRQVINGAPRSEQYVVVHKNEIKKKYIELTAPYSDIDGEKVAIQLLDMQYPLLSRSDRKLFSPDVNKEGGWGFWYADRATHDIELQNNITAARTLNNLVNPMFSWLHARGKKYAMWKSYEEAYWQTWQSQVLYGDGWYSLSYANAGKRWNQIYRDMALSWKWLQFDTCVPSAEDLTFTTMHSNSQGNKLSDIGWFVGNSTRDVSKVHNGRLSFTQHTNHYYGLLDPGVRALHVKFTAGTYNFNVLAGVNPVSEYGYRISVSNRFVNVTTKSHGAYSIKSSNDQQLWELQDGKEYILRVKSMRMRDLNYLASNKKLVLISVYDENYTPVSSVNITLEPEMGGRLGLMFKEIGVFSLKNIQFEK